MKHIGNIIVVLALLLAVGIYFGTPIHGVQMVQNAYISSLGKYVQDFATVEKSEAIFEGEDGRINAKQLIIRQSKEMNTFTLVDAETGGLALFNSEAASMLDRKIDDGDPESGYIKSRVNANCQKKIQSEEIYTSSYNKPCIEILIMK